jgi:hypothetical protein
MTLHAKWFSEHRKAENPPDPRYPLGMSIDCTGGRPGCAVSLEYPAPCVGKWIIRCDVCNSLSIVEQTSGTTDEPQGYQ